jgi:hypothetical protein
VSRHRHQRRRTVAVVVVVGVLAATAAVLLSGGRFWAGADPASRPSGAESLPVAGPPPTATTPPGVGRLGSAPTTAPPSRPPSSSLRAPRRSSGLPQRREHRVATHRRLAQAVHRTEHDPDRGYGRRRPDMGCVWIRPPTWSSAGRGSSVPATSRSASMVRQPDHRGQRDRQSGQCRLGCITWKRYVARRVDCHGVGDGMYITGANVTIEDSYLHDLVTCGSCHDDTLQATEARRSSSGTTRWRTSSPRRRSSSWATRPGR